jgi:hypothetical protein
VVPVPPVKGALLRQEEEALLRQEEEALPRQEEEALLRQEERALPSWAHSSRGAGPL